MKCGSSRLTWLRHKYSNQDAAHQEKATHTLSQVDINLSSKVLYTLGQQGHNLERAYSAYLEKEKEKNDYPVRNNLVKVSYEEHA